MHSAKTLLVLTLAIALGASACSKKNNAGGGGETTGNTASATPAETNAGETNSKPAETNAGETNSKPAETNAGSAAAPAGPADFKVDKEIADALDTLLKACPKLTSFDYPEMKCKEPRETYRKFMYSKKFGSFETLVSIFVGEDELKSRAAGWSLNTYTRSYIHDAEKDKSLLRPAVVAALTKRVKDSDPKKTYRAQNGMALAVMTNSLLGQHDVAVSLVSHFDPSVDMRTRWAHTSGLPQLMVYGRMDTFDYVKKQAEHAESTVVSSAFSAPRSMRSWTAEEEKTICEWAASHNSDVKKKAHPAYVLLKCKRDKDKYHKMIVNEAVKRAKANTIGTHTVQAVRDVCYTMPSKDRDGDATCKKIKTLLERLLRDKKKDPYVRTTALSSLCSVWPTPAHLKLAKKYSKHPDKKIADAAKRQAGYLEKRLAKKK